jgi:hypothetical protein
MTVVWPVVAGIALVASGTGAVNLIAGNHRKVKDLRKEKNELLKQKKEITFFVEPFYKKSFTANVVGLQMRLRF